MNSISQYTVGAVKSFRGHDGYAYSCNLLRNGKKVAEVLDDGWGGGLQFHWFDNQTSATVHTLTYDDQPHSFQGTVEESLFYAEVMKLPKIPTYDGKSEMNTSADIVIDEMVNDSLTTKKIKADLKKNITIQSKNGELLTWKITPVHTAEVLKNHALKKYPESIIMNDLPTLEVLKVYKAANVA